VKGWNLCHKTTNTEIIQYYNKPPEFIGGDVKVTFPSHSLEPEVDPHTEILNVVLARGKRK
jgi:hypothetical protein